MWTFKVLLALFGLRPWPISPPFSNIEVVEVTRLVVKAPSIWPTVTVTKTIGVPATSIDYAYTVASSTPAFPSPRPTLNPYNYPSPSQFASQGHTAIGDSAFQQYTSVLTSLSAPRYSTLDLIMYAFLAFSMMMMFLSYQILIKRNDRDTIVQKLNIMPEYIKSYFDYMAWQVNYIVLVIGQCIWLCGHCTSQTLFTFFVAYCLIATASMVWLLLKQRAAQGVRLVAQWAIAAKPWATQYARATGKWIALRSVQWYNDRISKSHIEKIFERKITKISIGECLFPDMYSVVPNHPTPSQVLNAMATDVFFFSWNLLTLLIKLRIQSCMQIQRHTKDVCRVTLQIIFGLDDDDLSWSVWMICFEYILRCIRMVIDTIYQLVIMFFDGIRAMALLLQACHRRAIVFFALETVGINRKWIENPQNYADEVFNAFTETASYNWCNTALLYLRLKAAEADLAEVRREPKVVKQKENFGHVRELANKCVGYRRTLLEVISDNNYLRLLACSILNAHHNITHGKKPNGLYAEHPYQPSLIKFTPIADQQTGLHLGYKEHTHQREHNLGHEYRLNVENFAMEIDREPHRMAAIIKQRPSLPGKVPDRFDPFLKDHWVFSGVIPGMNIPPYSKTNNPFDITTKRALPIPHPETQFGPQIEDFAAEGRLDQWTEVAGSNANFTPFSIKELQKFTREMRFGASPLKKHKAVSSGLPVRGYAADPCPRGEPRKRDFPVYRNFA